MVTTILASDSLVMKVSSYNRCSVSAVDRVLSEGSLSMEIIVNPKTLDNNIPVIQLETAVGAAMKCFEKGLGKRILSNSVKLVYPYENYWWINLLEFAYLQRYC